MSFTFEEPRTLDEALDLLAGCDASVRPIAGGTGLTLLMKYGFFEPTTLVSLRHLAPSLVGVDPTADGGLRLGAMTTLRQLETSPLVAERAPALSAAVRRVASVRIRNVAQLGGAIAHGNPQMDIPPVLLAMDAHVVVASASGTRRIPIGEVFRGYYETAVGDDELITAVELPGLVGHAGTYRKVTMRTADDWPMLGVAAVATRRRRHLEDVRVAVGAIGDRPQRLTGLEDALHGERPSADLLADAAREAAEEVELGDGEHGTAAFQRQILAVHLRRALHTVSIGDETGGLP